MGIVPLLEVYDMPTAVAFYRDALGFTIVNTSPEYAPGRFHWAMLTFGDAMLMLNTAYEFDDQRPVPMEPTRYAAHGDTALYIPCDDVDEIYVRLTRADVPANEPRITPYGAKECSLHDPDGYTVIFQRSNSNA